MERDGIGCYFSVVVLCISITAAAWSQGGFVEEISAEYRGEWREQRIGDIWHSGKPYVGGLGFEVVLDGWPRLLQRGFLDVVNKHNGNREVYDLAGWMDVGQVRAGDAMTPAVTLEESNWCYRKFVARQGDESLQFVVSRLTPAVLFQTDAVSIDLFAGEKTVGRGVKRNQTKTTGFPARVAFRTGKGVVVCETGEPIALSEMSESWLLFWYGRSSWFYRSRIPNIVWKMAPVREYMKTEYFHPADLPVLVVLEKKPRGLTATADGLRLTFGEGGAGSVIAMPLFGFYHPPADQTEKWNGALPDEIAERCAIWARRMKAVPLRCEEFRKVADDGGEVTIRQRFSYIDIEDDWKTSPERIAPIPPVASLAARYGFPLAIRGKAAALPVMTHSGPYTGLSKVDSVDFTVQGLNRYIAEQLDRPVPRTADAKTLVDEIRDETARMVEAGNLAPAASLDRHYVARIDWHFANPADTLLALAEAMPYLDANGRKAAAQYGRDLLQRRDPLRTESTPNFQGKRREYYNLLPPEVYMKIVGRDGQRMGSTPVPRQDRLNGLYAVWAFAEAPGDWSFVDTNWNAIREMMDEAAATREWATCGYFRGPNETRHYPGAGGGEDRGSVAAANGQFGRWIAMARVARRRGDREWRDRATYLLARTALSRFAQGKFIRYMYDEKFQTINTEPDWMLRLTTASGNGGGQGLLWTDRWAGPEDDVRQVIQWDEFGPLVAQAWGDHWHATQPLFQDLTPECARFLADHLRAECGRFVATVERNAPAWFITRRPSNIGKETAMDNPRNSYGTFLGKAYVLSASGEEMMRCQDIPFTRDGDLYHIRRLAANLACFSGLKWKKLEGAE